MNSIFHKYLGKYFFVYILFSFTILPKFASANEVTWNFYGYPPQPPVSNAPGGSSDNYGHGFSAQPSLQCGGSIFMRWQSAESATYNDSGKTYRCWDAGYVGSSHITGCFIYGSTTYYNIYQQLDAYNQVAIATNYTGTSLTYTPTNNGSGLDPVSDERVNPISSQHSDITNIITGDVTNSASDPKNYSYIYNFNIQACNSPINGQLTNDQPCNPNFTHSNVIPNYYVGSYIQPATVSSACTPNPPYKLNADVSTKQCGAIDLSWQNIPEFLSGKSPTTAYKIYRANVYSPSGQAKTVCNGNTPCFQSVDTSDPSDYWGSFGRDYSGTENYSYNNRIGTGEVPGNYTLIATISPDSTSYTDSTAFPYPGDLSNGQTFIGYKYKVVAVNSFGESSDYLISYKNYYSNTGHFEYGWYDTDPPSALWWPYYYGGSAPTLPDPYSDTHYVYIYTKGAVKSSGSCVPNGPGQLRARPSSQCGGAIDVSWENIPEFLSGKTPVTAWRIYRSPVYWDGKVYWNTDSNGNSTPNLVNGSYSLLATIPPSSTSTSYLYTDKKTLPYPTDTLQGYPFYGYNYKVVAVNSFGESTETLADLELHGNYYFSSNSWNLFHYYYSASSGYDIQYYDDTYKTGDSDGGYPWYTTTGSSNACAPTGVKVTPGPLCGQMTVSWDSNPLARYWYVLGKYTYSYYSTVGYNLPATTTSFIDDLKNHSDSITSPYKASVVSYKVQVNYDATSPEVYATSTACTFPAPTGVVAVTGDSCGGNISLGWSQVQGASGYRIYRSDSPTGVFTQIATSTSYSYYTGYYPFTDSSLSGGTTYYYKIDAYPSGGGSSTPSSVVSAVSSDICPATFDCYPSSDYVSAGDPVTWTAVVTGGTGGPYTYNWGDNNNSLYDNHTDSLDTSYSYYGYQPMSLQVIDANGNPIPVDGSYDTSNPWKQCSGYVYVSPPSLSFNCSPDQSSVGIGIPVTWSVSNIVGGSGNYYYDWYDPSNSSEYYDTSATESYSSAGSQGMYLSLYDYDTGSYSNWVQCSPNVDVAPDCTDPDGTSKTYYSAPMSTNCDLISETRTCNNGALDGDSNFNYSSCSNTTVPATIKDFKLNQNTINKGSSCQLTWDLNNANENTTCSLYRNSTNSLISDYTPAYSSGSYTDNGITNETTYKLICGELDENGVLTSTDTKYATCYINPTSKEHS